MAAIWGAAISAAGGLAAGGMSMASANSAANASAGMSKEQTALARQLLLEGFPLRAGLTSGMPAAADIDFVGMAARGEVQKQKEAFALLGQMGVDPSLVSSIKRNIAEHNVAKLERDQETLHNLRIQGTPGIFPQFFESGEIPEVIKPRPLAPLVNTYAPVREAVEDQFDMARESVLSRSSGRGGPLLEALRLVDVDRARTVAGLNADIAKQQQARDDQQLLQENALRQTLFGQGLQLAYGSVPTAMNAFGNAAAINAGLAQSANATAADAFRGAGASTALALALYKNQGQQTDVSTLGSVSPYMAPPQQFGGITQGGFGAYNV
jgi:hypothetical protein